MRIKIMKESKKEILTISVKEFTNDMDPLAVDLFGECFTGKTIIEK